MNERSSSGYASLDLSVCQTCKYKGLNFWRFLSSRMQDIDAFAKMKRCRQSTTVDVYPDGFIERIRERRHPHDDDTTDPVKWLDSG